MTQNVRNTKRVQLQMQHLDDQTPCEKICLTFKESIFKEHHFISRWIQSRFYKFGIEFFGGWGFASVGFFLC